MPRRRTGFAAASNDASGRSPTVPRIGVADRPGDQHDCAGPFGGPGAAGGVEDQRDVVPVGVGIDEYDRLRGRDGVHRTQRTVGSAGPSTPTIVASAGHCSERQQDHRAGSAETIAATAPQIIRARQPLRRRTTSSGPRRPRSPAQERTTNSAPSSRRQHTVAPTIPMRPQQWRCGEHHGATRRRSRGRGGGRTGPCAHAGV